MSNPQDENLCASEKQQRTQALRSGQVPAAETKSQKDEEANEEIAHLLVSCALCVSPSSLEVALLCALVHASSLACLTGACVVAAGK